MNVMAEDTTTGGFGVCFAAFTILLFIQRYVWKHLLVQRSFRILDGLYAFGVGAKDLDGHISQGRQFRSRHRSSEATRSRINHNLPRSKAVHSEAISSALRLANGLALSAVWSARSMHLQLASSRGRIISGAFQCNGVDQ